MNMWAIDWPQVHKVTKYSIWKGILTIFRQAGRHKMKK